MISKKIAKFSEFVGKPWRNPIPDPVSFDDISNTYNRAKKTIENLKVKNYNYIVQTLKFYGEMEELKLIINSPRYTYTYDRHDKSVTIVDNDAKDDVFNFEDLSPETQFDFLERLNLHIVEAGLEKRKVWEED